MNKQERNRKIYELTRHFILEQMLAAEGFDPVILDKYIFWKDDKPRDMPELYQRLLSHAKNTRAGGQGDIEKVFGTRRYGEESPEYKRWQIMKGVLFDYDPYKVVSEYQTIEDLQAALVEAYGSMTLKHFSTRYCGTMFEGAQLLSHFDTTDQFFKLIDTLYAINPAFAANLIDNAVPGFGYALSRDFLKEMGYLRFVKPDDHVLDICELLELTDGRDQLLADKAVTEIADDAGVEPYTIDKMFFLLGSGNFYSHPEARQRFDTNGYKKTKRKAAFAEYVLGQLEK
jgi:hypothetical protein